jgi:hypothetical protein
MLIQYPILSFLTTIARESLITSDIGWIASPATGGRVVTKTGSCGTTSGPSSSLKTALLSDVVSTSSGGQEVLAGLESVDEAVCSSTDRVNGGTIDHTGDTIQGTVVTASTTNLQEDCPDYIFRRCGNSTFFCRLSTYTVKDTSGLVVDRDAHCCSDRDGCLSEDKKVGK